MLEGCRGEREVERRGQEGEIIDIFKSDASGVMGVNTIKINITNN